MSARTAFTAMVVFVALAGPAFAVPPVLPRDTKVIETYMRSVSENDLAAYAALFSDQADIRRGDDKPISKAQWIELEKPRFAPARQTRFLSVVGGHRVAPGRGAQFALTMEQQRCIRGVTACFAAFRTEAITVLDGRIVALEQSENFTHRLTPEGSWTFSFSVEPPVFEDKPPAAR